MKLLLLVLFLFVGMHLSAQKKQGISQRNFDELKKDLVKAQKGLEAAKSKLVKVQNKVTLIAQQKTEQLNKNTSVFVNKDSVYEAVKKQKAGHFKIAEKRVEAWQRRFDKINSNYLLMIQRDSVIPDKHHFLPIIDKGFYVSFNPEAAFELQQGAVGVGAGFRLFARLEVWAEASYLYRGIGSENDNFKNLQGFKGIMSAKYFYKNKHKFFFGLEFRYKQYLYDDKANFENKLTIDTLSKYAYKLQNTLLGGGVFFGKRFKLSKNGKFEIEALAGSGLKYRFVNYKNVPSGYSKIPYTFERGPIHLFPVDYSYREQWVPYFPIALRFVYHF